VAEAVPTTRAAARATTPLLTLITQQSLDEDYQMAADRRAREGTAAASRRRRHLVAAVVVAVFGVLVAVAGAQTSEHEGVASAGRETLVAQINAGRAHLSRLQAQMVALREQDLRLQARLSRASAAALDARTREQRLQDVTGFGAVQGPGVKVVVDDAPDGTLVADRDLRPLVNGLWSAGAEAVSVDGQRLTARSAIRNSGDAIRVNNRSLSPPYVILAVGDPDTLQADLMDTTSGLVFRATAQHFGFPWSMDNEDHLELPAAPARVQRLREVRSGTAAQNQARDRVRNRVQPRQPSVHQEEPQ
jgi:uncharacterized protein YlxW (UPF0749 family)